MKNILIIFAMILTSEAMAVCSSPIARTNFSNLQVLTSTRLNTELNTVYTRANELPGDCITDESVTSAKIDDGTIVNADISASAAIDISKIGFKVAIVKEVQASGAGGTNTAGSFQTRILNTEVDPDNIVTIAANQFTLQAGTYLIEGSVPASAVNAHQSRLRNITDSTNAIIGTSEYSDGTDAESSRSELEGIVTVAAAKTFEVQHYTQTSKVVVGYGVSSGYAGEEVFTTVKIIKIK